MKKQLALLLSFFIIFFGASSFSQAPSDSLYLQWGDLIPEDIKEKAQRAQEIILSMDAHDGTSDSFNALNNMEDLGKARQDLDGKNVHILGFIVPLEFDQVSITEFLLVPYMGACIHVPPPPANQVILVTSKDPIKVDDIYYPFEIKGKLTIEKNDTNMARSAYKITAKSHHIVMEDVDFFIEDEIIEEEITEEELPF